MPERLLAYPARTGELDHDLRRRAWQVVRAMERFADTRPEFGARTPDPGPEMLRLADEAEAFGAWVGRVGRAFSQADLARFLLPGVLLLGRNVPVTVGDAALVAAGWPTHAEAAAAGHAFADEIATALAGHGDVDATTLEAWRDRMAVHSHDPAFTAGFFTRLGADGTLALPQLVEEQWPPDDRWGTPAWGLAVLAPFSRALATAMAADGLPAAHRLPTRVTTEIVDHDAGYDPNQPEAHHHALLFSAGTFPTPVLLRLGALVVTPTLERRQRLGPIGLTAWGPGADPTALVLGALARNPEAATRFVDKDDNLDLLLERWPELDGDAGQAGAEVLRLALTGEAGNRRRAERLFDQAMQAVERIGAIRNPFAAEPLAEAAAVHIGHLQRLAATEGGGADGHADLVTARVFLTHLFDGANGDEPARRLYAASAGAVYDTVNHLGGDADRGLSSEAWDVGSLLGLVLTADARAAVADTTDRIARRQALLDGLRQVTDLALTFTAGRWIPFAKAGRDHLLSQHTLDHELDETLADADAFEAALRFELSAVFAVRLAHDGVLDVPPGVALVPLADMTDDERRAFHRWVDSPPVRDAIGRVRLEAGQRMDEVEDALDGRG